MSDDFKTVILDEASNFACTAVEEMRGKLIVGEPEREELTLEEDVVDDFLTLENDGEKLVLEAGDEQLVLADSEFHSKRDIREFEVNVRNVLESLAYTVADRLRTQFSILRREREQSLLAFYNKLTERNKQKADFKFNFLTTVAASALRTLRQTIEELTTKLNLNEMYLQASRRQVESLEKVISENKRPAIYVIEEEPYKFSFTGPGWVVVDATWKRGPLHLNQNGRGYLATANSSFTPTVFASEADAQKAIEDTTGYKPKYAWTQNTYVAVQIVK